MSFKSSKQRKRVMGYELGKESTKRELPDTTNIGEFDCTVCGYHFSDKAKRHIVSDKKLGEFNDIFKHWGRRKNHIVCQKCYNKL